MIKWVCYLNEGTDLSGHTIQIIIMQAQFLLLNVILSTVDIIVASPALIPSLPCDRAAADLDN